jgi:hypothetical protein
MKSKWTKEKTHGQAYKRAMQNHPELFADICEVPRSFKEAWNHPDPFQRKKWRDAILKELNKMRIMNIWRLIKIAEMEPGKKCIKYKWVLTIKRNGTFRAQLVACGYSQVLGIDFTEYFAPVLTDIGYRLLLIVLMKKKWKGYLIDVETAFLHGQLEERIYMECPQRLEHKEDEVCYWKSQSTDWCKQQDSITRSGHKCLKN